MIARVFCTATLVARRADGARRRRPRRRARDLRTADQAGGPALSAAEYLHRRRLAAVAAFAGRTSRSGTALAGHRRLRRAIFPAGRRAFRRRPLRAGRGGNRQRRRWKRDWRNWKRAQASGKLAPGRAAIEICRGIKAFAAGDNDERDPSARAAMSELVRIGGSHAQRELWEDTLIVAYLRAGHGDKAARTAFRAAARPQAFRARYHMALRLKADVEPQAPLWRSAADPIRFQRHTSP